MNLLNAINALLANTIPKAIASPKINAPITIDSDKHLSFSPIANRRSAVKY